MSESRAKRYRYWLTYLLPELPVGATFEPGELHITVLPWFVVEVDQEELIDSFHSVFASLSPFDALVSSEVNLGPRKDISVYLIEAGPAIFELHARAIEWLQAINGRWAVKNPYVDDDYKPHIRKRTKMVVTEGDALRIDSLTLVKANRRPDNIRTVAAKVVWQ